MRRVVAWYDEVVSRRNSRIQRLLNSDCSAPREVFSVLAKFDSDAPRAIDEMLELYVEFFRIANSSHIDRDAEAQLKSIAKERNVAYDKLIQLLRRTDEGSEPSSDMAAARAIYLPYRAREAGLLLFTMAGRYYRYMATDLLRGRVTSALGYLRLQTEAVALAHLIDSQPREADAWLAAAEPNVGKKFYGRTQRTLRSVIDELGLASAYELGSFLALHVRIPTLARAAEMEQRENTSFVWMRDRELNPSSPYEFLQMFLLILRFEGLLLRGMMNVRSDLSFGPLKLKLLTYDTARLRMEKKFSDQFDSEPE